MSSGKWDQIRAKAERFIATRMGGMIRRMQFGPSNSGLWSILGVPGESDADLEVFHNIGFAARPPAGSTDAEVIVVQIGASSGHPVIVASRNKADEFDLTDDDECAIWNTTSVVYIKKDGTIEARTRGGTAVALATLADVQSIRTDLNSHTHDYVAPLHPHGVQPGVTTGNPTVTAPTGTTKLKGE